MKAARILIVEALPMMRLGLRSAIDATEDLVVCGEAADSATALMLIDRSHPDLVVVDLSLMDGSGLELIKQISCRSDPPRILVASMHDEMLFAERSLRAGAMGYVSNDAPPETVVEAVRRVLKGKVYLSPRMTEHLLQRFAVNPRDVTSPELEVLTDRELEVFELLGHGIGTRAIAERLGISFKTVESYRESIKKKLGLTTGPKLIRRAVQWVLEEQ